MIHKIRQCLKPLMGQLIMMYDQSFNGDDFLIGINFQGKPGDGTTQDNPANSDPNNQGPPLDPNGYPQYVYATNNLSPEQIREAFAKVKQDRQTEMERMRKEEAIREKAEEEAAEKERKRLDKEVEKIKKKREEEKKK